MEVYHLAARLLDQPIFDISASSALGARCNAQQLHTAGHLFEESFWWKCSGVPHKATALATAVLPK